MLEVSGLCVGYGREDVLRDVSFAMAEGEFVCVLGANGCGKTTLLKAILGILRPGRGGVTLCGEEVHRLDAGRLARRVAYIPQAHVPPFPFRVREVVMMGRTPYLGYLARPGAEDRKIVDEVLETLDIGWMADRVYTKLSGGQRQSLAVASALARSTNMGGCGLIEFDETTAALGVRERGHILALMDGLRRQNFAVLCISHNLPQVLELADRICILRGGAVVWMGRRREKRAANPNRASPTQRG